MLTPHPAPDDHRHWGPIPPSPDGSPAPPWAIRGPLLAASFALVFLAIDARIWWTSTVHGPGGWTERGWSFDLVPDVIGALIAIIALPRIARVMPSPGWRTAMHLITVIMFAGLIVAIADHWRPGGELDVKRRLLAVAELISLSVFIVGMHAFCSHHRLTGAARSWTVTLILTLVIWVLPALARHLAHLAIDLQVAGPNGLAVELVNVRIPQLDIVSAAAMAIIALAVGVLIMLLPLIHFIMSASRTRRAVRPSGPEHHRQPDPSVPTDVWTRPGPSPASRMP